MFKYNVMHMPKLTLKGIQKLPRFLMFLGGEVRVNHGISYYKTCFWQLLETFFIVIFKLRQRLIRNDQMTYLWGNWPHRPGFPSRSRGRVGFRPQGEPPSCTETPGSGNAGHKPLETERPPWTAAPCRRPPTGSPSAPRSPPPRPECTSRPSLLSRAVGE